MKTRILQRSIHLNKSLEEVFVFFSKAENLNQLTPPNLHFTILSPAPIAMQEGTLIDYRIKLFGIAFHWKTKITAWHVNEYFEDAQLKGPYKQWIHKHEFITTPTGVLMNDTVHYRCPGWIFEPILFHLFIKNNLEQIFDYRAIACERIFNAGA